MAGPVSTNTTRNTGNHWAIIHHAIWTDTTNYTDLVIADLSAMTNTTRLLVQGVIVQATTGISVNLKLDNGSGTDQSILRVPLANLGPVTVDYSRFPDSGVKLYAPASDAVGDLTLTTLSAAAADEVMIVAWGTCE